LINPTSMFYVTVMLDYLEYLAYPVSVLTLR
jgi:hypothetical protein